MKKILSLITAFALLTLMACSNSGTPSSSASTPSQSSENVREANEPFELIGTPDRIYIVKGENERTIGPGTNEYNEVLELLRSRFPERLKEAARAITWADEAGFNRDMMREEFDFIELSYDVAQNVKLNCMNNDDYPLKEITFEMMIFPLSEITETVSIDTHKTSGVVGRSYGPLDKSAEIIAELSGYSVVRESGSTESKTESEPDKPQSQNEDTHAASQAGDNSAAEQQLAPATYSEQAMEGFLTYLEQSLTGDQHGGVHRISDFNGSGLQLHGGPDKADPYIVIWVVDKNAVNSIVESYTGQKVDVVRIDAAYSISQLNSVINELQNNEIASNINEMLLSDDNKVIVDIIGKDNQDKVTAFLASYKYKDAVSLFVRPETGENPTT